MVVCLETKSLQTTKPFLLSFPFRAEGLAAEIKDLQGQLADYNMVNINSIFSELFQMFNSPHNVRHLICIRVFFNSVFVFPAGGQAQHQRRDGGHDQ